MSQSQIPLPFIRFDRFDFAGYVAGPNAAVLDILIRTARGQSRGNLYLWGPSGTGKSHLLQAASSCAADQQLRVAYIPLAQLADLTPGMLQGLDMLDLVCIDDLQHAAGSAPWEQALFHLFNRLRERGRPLLMSADQGPQSIGIQLPDLQSRLAWDLVFHLQPLDEASLIQALQRRARARMFDFPDEVLDYLVKRVSRDTHSLFRLLDRLDEASLASKKKITIPFVKEELGI
jgi:DnaA family protein